MAALRAALKTQGRVDQLARCLIAQARRAQVLRSKDTVKSLSQLLLDLPVCESIHSAGRYYEALSLKADGRRSEAEATIHNVLPSLEPSYLPRAIFELAGLKLDAGQTTEARMLYSSASDVAQRQSDDLTAYDARRMQAVVKAVDGNHPSALTDLLSLWPICQALSLVYPILRFDLLNSIALELGEVGRVEEATRIIDPLLSTPMAVSFPEWHLTKLELATMQRRVFAPFTLALGAPAESTEKPKPFAAKSVVAATAATALRLESETARVQIERYSIKSARDTKPAVNLSRKPEPVIRIPFWAALLVPYLERSVGSEPTNNVKTACQLSRSAHPGYHLSPPSRAPPADLPDTFSK